MHYTVILNIQLELGVSIVIEVSTNLIVCQSYRLFKVQPYDDFGARRRRQRAAVREVPPQVVRQYVEEGEGVVHDDGGVRLSDVQEGRRDVIVRWVLVSV